jgi:hypothetical protein
MHAPNPLVDEPPVLSGRVPPGLIEVKQLFQKRPASARLPGIPIIVVRISTIRPLPFISSPGRGVRAGSFDDLVEFPTV